MGTSVPTAKLPFIIIPECAAFHPSPPRTLTNALSRLVESGGVTNFLNRRLTGDGVDSFMATLRVVCICHIPLACLMANSDHFQCQGIAVRATCILLIIGDH